MSEFKYDLAISFLQEDEGIASRLATKLAETYSVFLYSQRQRELAGTDGEVKFRTIFGEESRYVAVLYRPGWGETQWTRVEAEAIRDRTAREGYEFFKLLMIESGFRAPPWVPKHQLWVNYERFGFDEVVAVLDCRLQELGAEPQVETPQVIASRIKRKQEYGRIREEMRRSDKAVQLLKAYFENLGLTLKIETEKIKAISPNLAISVAQQGREIKIDHGAFNVTVYLTNEYSNVVGDQSGIHVIFGERPAIWQTDSYGRGPRKLREESFLFDYLNSLHSI